MVENAPKIRDNPIGAIGLVLSNVAAGIRGQELPTTQLRKERMAQRELELRQLGVTLKAVKEGVGLFAGVDRNNPKIAEQMAAFTGQFSEALPGFENALTIGLDIAERVGTSALVGAGEHFERIYAICGLDKDCIRKTISDSDTMKRFDQTADNERLPGIVQKFQTITEGVGGNAELKKLIADGTWSLSDLHQLPEEFAFTEDELRTISRSGELQSALIEFGFEPTSVVQKGAEAQATGALGQKTQALVDQGVPLDIATKAAAGVFQTATDSFGRATIVDTTTGEVIWPKKGETPAPPSQETPPAQTGLSEATGGQSVLENAVNVVTDFFGAGLQFENTAAAIDHLKSLKTFTTLGLSQQLATRDTNLVRNMLFELFPEPKTLKMGDARSLSKLEAVRDQLTFILEGEQQVVDNPESFPPDMVQKAVASTHNLTRLVAQYNGIIDNWFEKSETRFREGDKAVNKAGDRIIFRNGKWVPLK